MGSFVTAIGFRQGPQSWPGSCAMYYNPKVPLETALEMFDDPHIRYEIIEDYHHALEAELGKLALEPTDGENE